MSRRRIPPVIVSYDDRIREFVHCVLWLEDGQFKSERRVVPDPMCGMEVDPQKAVATATIDGIGYFFCARGCRDEFHSRHVIEEEIGRIRSRPPEAA